MDGKNAEKRELSKMLSAQALKRDTDIVARVSAPAQARDGSGFLGIRAEGFW